MSAWGLPPSSGAWSNQVDEEEEANGGELAPPPAALPAAFPILGGKTAFPALGEALSMKDSKKERKQKKVKQAMSLGAFVAAGKKEPEIIDLPTGPRQRSEHEEAKKGGLGGGFKNYGGDRGTPHQGLGFDFSRDAYSTLVLLEIQRTYDLQNAIPRLKVGYCWKLTFRIASSIENHDLFMMLS